MRILPLENTPVTAAAVILVFELVVNDGSLASAPDSVAITVNPVNDAPTADAGADQIIAERAPVTLDGSAS